MSTSAQPSREKIYAAIRKTSNNAIVAEALGISEASVRAYRANLTMGKAPQVSEPIRRAPARRATPVRQKSVSRDFSDIRTGEVRIPGNAKISVLPRTDGTQSIRWTLSD